jgi:hypothetical protein
MGVNGLNIKRFSELEEKLNPQIIYLPKNPSPPEAIKGAGDGITAGESTIASEEKPSKSERFLGNDKILKLISIMIGNEKRKRTSEDASKKDADLRSKLVFKSEINFYAQKYERDLKKLGIPKYIYIGKNKRLSVSMDAIHSMYRLKDDKRNENYLRGVHRALFRTEGIQLDYSRIINRSVADGINLLSSWEKEITLAKSLANDEETKILDAFSQKRFNPDKIGENYIISWLSNRSLRLLRKI